MDNWRGSPRPSPVVRREPPVRPDAVVRLMKAEKAPEHRYRSLARGTDGVLHFWSMGHTITVRLTAELAAWLEDVAARTGVPQGRIIRDQLERAKSGGTSQSFMRLAGSVKGPRTLSSRKGFFRP